MATASQEINIVPGETNVNLTPISIRYKSRIIWRFFGNYYRDPAKLTETVTGNHVREKILEYFDETTGLVNNKESVTGEIESLRNSIVNEIQETFNPDRRQTIDFIKQHYRKLEAADIQNYMELEKLIQTIYGWPDFPTRDDFPRAGTPFISRQNILNILYALYEMSTGLIVPLGGSGSPPIVSGGTSPPTTPEPVVPTEPTPEPRPVRRAPQKRLYLYAWFLLKQNTPFALDAHHQIDPAVGIQLTGFVKCAGGDNVLLALDPDLPTDRVKLDKVAEYPFVSLVTFPLTITKIDPSAADAAKRYKYSVDSAAMKYTIRLFSDVAKGNERGKKEMLGEMKTFEKLLTEYEKRLAENKDEAIQWFNAHEDKEKLEHLLEKLRGNNALVKMLDGRGATVKALRKELVEILDLLLDEEDSAKHDQAVELLKRRGFTKYGTVLDLFRKFHDAMEKKNDRIGNIPGESHPAEPEEAPVVAPPPNPIFDTHGRM